MTFKILTLFPDMFMGVINSSILGRAQANGLIHIELYDIREHAEGKHKVADEPPYGGGAGMVMKPGPVDKCLCAALGCASPDCRPKEKTKVMLMSPQGRTFDQKMAVEITASYETVVMICGHYEGIDERILDLWVDEELSIGDYVLTGGEIPAMIVIDACSRMIPGVLGHEESAAKDSFMDGALDFPHYTRPPVFRGVEVPEVLLSGHHENIRKWRRTQSLLKTRRVRPDLYANLVLSKEDIKLLKTADEKGLL
jgi:tRNA (guanine37-N1)-methyltransferase